MTTKSKKTLEIQKMNGKMDKDVFENWFNSDIEISKDDENFLHKLRCLYYWRKMVFCNFAQT